MERRGVLQKLAAGAAVAAAGTLPYGLASLLAPGGAKAQRNYLRPPGALADDAAFVAACIGCGLCGEVCPTEALTPTPRAEIDMGLAQIDRTACYPWVDRGVCGACVSVCPLGEKALGFQMWNQYRPVVREGCVGCGLCVEVCPHPSVPIWIVERTQEAAAKQKV